MQQNTSKRKHRPLSFAFLLGFVSVMILLVCPAFADPTDTESQINTLYRLMRNFAIPVGAVGMAICGFMFFFGDEQVSEKAVNRIKHLFVASLAIFVLGSTVRFAIGFGKQYMWEPGEDHSSEIPIMAAPLPEHFGEPNIHMQEIGDVGPGSYQDRVDDLGDNNENDENHDGIADTTQELEPQIILTGSLNITGGNSETYSYTETRGSNGSFTVNITNSSSVSMNTIKNTTNKSFQVKPTETSHGTIMVEVQIAAGETSDGKKVKSGSKDYDITVTAKDNVNSEQQQYQNRHDTLEDELDAHRDEMVESLGLELGDGYARWDGFLSDLMQLRSDLNLSTDYDIDGIPDIENCLDEIQDAIDDLD